MEYIVDYKPEAQGPPYCLPEKLRNAFASIGISIVFQGTNSPMIIVDIPDDKLKAMLTLEGIVRCQELPLPTAWDG